MYVSNRKYNYPFNIEREYINFLKRYTKLLRKNTLDNIDNIYQLVKKWSIYKHDDDENEDIDEEINTDIIIPLMLFMTAFILRQELGRLFNSVNSYVLNDLQKEAKNALKRTAKETEVLAQLEASQYDMTEIEALKETFISDNIELVTKMTDDYKYKLKNTIKTAIDNNYSKEELTEAIKKNINITDNRAELIAVDQIGKINGRLEQYYQQKIGVEHYIWSTMKDSRVRPTHRMREGKTFSWNNPPSDGHPGMAIRCRCKAKPVFED